MGRAAATLCEFLTKDQPLTSHTKERARSLRSRSKPHTFCPNASVTMRAISFSCRVYLSTVKPGLSCVTQLQPRQSQDMGHSLVKHVGYCDKPLQLLRHAVRQVEMV